MLYLDTSSLVALYYPESRTERLFAHLRRKAGPMAFTWLNEVEFVSAMRLKVFRREAGDAAASAAIHALRQDMADNIYQRPPVDWPAVFQQAAALANAHSRHHGSRTLDLIHVATALALPAGEFITGDDRQAAVARQEGLKVIKI